MAGSIFTFSLSLGDYIAVKIVGGTSQLLGNVVYDNSGAANNLPFAAAVATVPIVVMVVYLAAGPTYRRPGEPLMVISRGLRRFLAVFTAMVLVFAYVPLALVLLNSFNTDNTFGWPPPGLTLHWWQLAWQSQGARDALLDQHQGRARRDSGRAAARQPRRDGACAGPVSSAATSCRC